MPDKLMRLRLEDSAGRRYSARIVDVDSGHVLQAKDIHITLATNSNNGGTAKVTATFYCDMDMSYTHPYNAAKERQQSDVEAPAAGSPT